MMRRRGSVALSPAFFRSCDVVIAAYDIVFDRSVAVGLPSMRLFVCAGVVSFLLAGCQSFSWPSMPTLSSFGVYKLDINQGNYVTQDQAGGLKVGQPRQQVRLVLGTPLLADPFHADRWDYVYEF